MKTAVSLLSLATLLAIGPVGCSRSDSTSGSGGAPSSGTVAGFDLSRVEGAFATASGAVKTQFQSITDYVKNGNYSSALEKLQTLAASAELSPDQKSAVNQLIADVKAKGGDVLTGAGATALKAVEQAKETAAKVAVRASDAASQVSDATTKKAAEATDAAKKATGNLLPK